MPRPVAGSWKYRLWVRKKQKKRTEATRMYNATLKDSVTVLRNYLMTKPDALLSDGIDFLSTLIEEKENLERD